LTIEDKTCVYENKKSRNSCELIILAKKYTDRVEILNLYEQMKIMCRRTETYNAGTDHGAGAALYVVKTRMIGRRG